MRKLTFEGFLKQYVTELSGVQTASIHKLANCLHENPRLKEPLYLYALVFDKVNLCSAMQNTLCVLQSMNDFQIAIRGSRYLRFCRTSRQSCRRAI